MLRLLAVKNARDMSHSTRYIWCSEKIIFFTAKFSAAPVVDCTGIKKLAHYDRHPFGERIGECVYFLQPQPPLVAFVGVGS